MDDQATAEILRVFERLPDPRRANARHKRIDILTIALVGVICGAGGWDGVWRVGSRERRPRGLASRC